MSQPPPARTRPYALAAWPAGFVLAFYALLYPIQGFRVPLGSDIPVYVWWARFAGAEGIGGLGTRARPGMAGVLATLSRITGVQAAGVAEALAPAAAAILGLAAASMVAGALGPHRRRFVLTVGLTGAFLSLMVSGYLSTLTFGCCFVAALAVAADRAADLDGRAIAAIALLIAAAGLAHLLFLVLAGAVVAGIVVGLVPAAVRGRRAGVPLTRSAAARVAAAAAGGAGLSVAGFLAVGSGAAAPETSRDAILRRAGLRRELVVSYRRKLIHDFPWYRAATAVAAAAWAGPLAARARGGRGSVLRRWFDAALPPVVLWGAVSTWVLITLGAVVALAVGIGAPGQRLAAFCVPVPVLGAIGLSRLWERRRAAAVAGAAAFVVVAFLAWGGQHPLVKNVAVEQTRAAGAALAATEPGTPLVLVVDDRGDKPGLFITRYENNMRAEVPPARVPDVHLFVGLPGDYLAGRPTLTGDPEHDAMATASASDVRSLPSDRTLALTIQGFDPTAFDAALALSGAEEIFPGVAVLPARAGVPCRATCPEATAQTAPGTGLLSPWLPVWLAPLLVALLGFLGRPWAERALPASTPLVRWSLAPAFGLAALSIAAIVTDAAGIRLSGLGAWLTLALVGAGWHNPPRRPDPAPDAAATPQPPGPKPR